MANKYLNDTGLQYFFNKLKTLFLTSVDYDNTNKKITKTVNGTASDVVTLATLKTDMALNNVANGAEVNQNAFSNVKVGTTTVAADSKTDTLTLEAGSNVTITPDATNDKITIAATDTVYTHPTYTAKTASAVKVGNDATGHVVIGDTLTKSDVGLGNVTDGAQVNVIETIKVNGTALTVTDKTVDVFVPISQVENGSYSEDNRSWAILTFKYTPTDTSTGTLYVPTTGSNGMINKDNLPSATSSAKGAVIVDTALSASSTNPVQNKAINTALGNKANLASPALTGTPTAPTATAGTNTTQIATTAFVKTAVDNAISGITGFDIQVVTALPTTGVKGTIYLMSHSHGTDDSYDEYIWTGSAYEKIGNTDVDLSGYMKTTDMVAITTTEIDTLFA